MLLLHSGFVTKGLNKLLTCHAHILQKYVFLGFLDNLGIVNIDCKVFYCQALVPNPLVPNPKPRGLGLTLKCCRPPPTITFKHEGGVPQKLFQQKKKSGGQREQGQAVLHNVPHTGPQAQVGFFKCHKHSDKVN